MSEILNYRQRIYEKYRSHIQQSEDILSPRAAGRFGAAYGYFLRKWLPNNKEARIIDLACGNGQLLNFYKQLGYRNVSGVDISAQQVEASRKIVGEVTRADIMAHLRSYENSFDFISAIDIMEHLCKNEILDFLDGCLRALKPGGRLIIQTPNAESWSAGAMRYCDLTHEVSFTPPGLTRLLGLCGFKTMACRELPPVPWGYSFKSTLRYLLWQGIRAVMKTVNVIETGGSGSGIFTRVFLISGIKE